MVDFGWTTGLGILPWVTRLARCLGSGGSPCWLP